MFRSARPLSAGIVLAIVLSIQPLAGVSQSPPPASDGAPRVVWSTPPAPPAQDTAGRRVVWSAPPAGGSPLPVPPPREVTGMVQGLQVVLKGRLLTAQQPPAALLEVNGKTVLVRKGSQVPTGGRQAIRVLEINRSEVQIEVLPAKELLVLQ